MNNVSRRSKLLLLFAVALLFAGCSTTAPLITAAEKGDTKEIERLIASGADVNVKDDFGLTPLHFAVRSGNNEIVEILLSNGADVNAKNFVGSSPLDDLKVSRHTSIVSLLENPKYNTETNEI